MRTQSRPTGGSYQEPFRKSWPDILLEEQKSTEEKPYVEDAIGDHLLFLLQGYGVNVPFFQIDEIITYCCGVDLSILRKHGSDQRRTVWLDDRSWSYNKNLGTSQTPTQNEANARSEPQGQPKAGGMQLQVENMSHTLSQDVVDHNITTNSIGGLPSRKYERRLNAAELYRHLKQKVWWHFVIMIGTAAFYVDKLHSALCFTDILRLRLDSSFGRALFPADFARIEIRTCEPT